MAERYAVHLPAHAGAAGEWQSQASVLVVDVVAQGNASAVSDQLRPRYHDRCDTA